MTCVVMIKQGYHSTVFEFPDEMSALQFATISKEHAIEIVDRDGDPIRTSVTVLIDPDKDNLD